MSATRDQTEKYKKKDLTGTKKAKIYTGFFFQEFLQRFFYPFLRKFQGRGFHSVIHASISLHAFSYSAMFREFYQAKNFSKTNC